MRSHSQTTPAAFQLKASVLLAVFMDPWVEYHDVISYVSGFDSHH